MVIVGSDPEMADYDNPRGHLYGFASYVIAEDKAGNRCRRHVATERRESDALAPAEALAATLQTRLDNLGKPPVGFDGWEAHRPAYGSPAWQAYGEDDEIALERREAEDEAWERLY